MKRISSFLYFFFLVCLTAAKNLRRTASSLKGNRFISHHRQLYLDKREKIADVSIFDQETESEHTETKNQSQPQYIGLGITNEDDILVENENNDVEPERDPSITDSEIEKTGTTFNTHKKDKIVDISMFSEEKSLPEVAPTMDSGIEKGEFAVDPLPYEKEREAPEWLGPESKPEGEIEIEPEAEPEIDPLDNESERGDYGSRVDPIDNVSGLEISPAAERSDGREGVDSEPSEVSVDIETKQVEEETQGSNEDKPILQKEKIAKVSMFEMEYFENLPKENEESIEDSTSANFEIGNNDSIAVTNNRNDSNLTTSIKDFFNESFDNSTNSSVAIEGKGENLEHVIFEGNGTTQNTISYKGSKLQSDEKNDRSSSVGTLRYQKSILFSPIIPLLHYVIGLI